ncbi:hypothetical protein DH2020_050051 [Rehmannia glutinosa]|uniref:Uncharacterized protein n=1 Tax=Rehmannia glutinosa TaxID=99300 RepID=A0ABR0U1Z6_REHGL
MSIFVNGERLSQEELTILQSCQHPPQKLKPGYYWYDKLSGFWGKAAMKLLCSLLSLPFPPKSDYASGEQSVPDYLELNDNQKLLLIGCSESGTSTIFNQAADIFKPYYKPSHMDILYAEAPSLVSSMIFSFPLLHDDDIDSVDPKGVLLRYGLTRVSIDGFGDDCKWLEGFVEKGIVIFCISLNDYDLLVMGDNGASVNKMMVARKVFESFVTMCHQINVLLLLTKYDLFEEKIQRIPLNQCNWLNDFNPVKRFYGNKNLGQMGFHYISIKFKRLYTALTGRKLYVAPVNCLKQDSVDAAFKYARDILKWVQWGEETEDYFSEESFYSDDE